MSVKGSKLQAKLSGISQNKICHSSLLGKATVYMYVISVISFFSVSDPCSYEHYLSSCEGKT